MRNDQKLAAGGNMTSQVSGPSGEFVPQKMNRNVSDMQAMQI